MKVACQPAPVILRRQSASTSRSVWSHGTTGLQPSNRRRAGRIAAAPRDVARPHPGGVRLDRGRDAGQREQRRHHVPQLSRRTGGDVQDAVGQHRLGVAQAGDVGGADVAHVEEIPRRVEIADAQHRRGTTPGDRGRLPGEGGHHERIGLAGAGVVEGTDAHDAQAAPGHRPERQVGGRLARGIDIRGCQQCALVDRQPRGHRPAVDVGAGGEQQHAVRRVAQDGAGQVQRAAQIDPPRGVRVVLGLRDRRDRRQMHAGVRAQRCHLGGERVRIGHVGRRLVQQRRGEGAAQGRAEMPAHEPGGPGEQDAARRHRPP